MDDINILENDICNFNIIQNAHLLKNKSNILSCVFFKREKYYKNFDIYVTGLKHVIAFESYWNTEYPNDPFNLLLFIDKNIYIDHDIMDIIKKGKNTIVLMFNCPNYLDQDYHFDLFGTLVRFFPLFDFPNNPFNIVITIDVDLKDDNYRRLMTIMRNKPSGLTAEGVFLPLLYNKHGKGYIYAGMCSVVENKKYDKNILMTFIKNADQYESKGYYGKRETTFGFGIDEIFLNDIMAPIIKNFNIIFEYHMNDFFYYSKEYILHEKRLTNTNHILSYILGKYNREYASIQIKLKFIDEEIIDKIDFTSKSCYFSKRFSNVIKYLYENKKKWLQRRIIQFIHKYLLDTLYAIVLINITNATNDGDINNCILYDQIQCDDLNDADDDFTTTK